MATENENSVSWAGAEISDIGEKTYTLSKTGNTVSAQVETSAASDAKISMQSYIMKVMQNIMAKQQAYLTMYVVMLQDVNNAIVANNTALKDSNSLYEKAYNFAIQTDHSKGTESINFASGEYVKKSSPSTIDFANLDPTTGWTNVYIDAGPAITGASKLTTIEDGNSTKSVFQMPVGRYNKDGDGGGGKNVQNVDVEEQSGLTEIQNLQENLRMYGDRLTADSSLFNSKMSQYMQTVNNNTNLISQFIKNNGDYLRTTLSNLR